MKGLIGPDEKRIDGKWVVRFNSVVADANGRRIKKLLSKYLEEICRHENGWEILYMDPRDGRYWELTYPHGEWHGGGPQSLRVLTSDEVIEKYNIKS